jgi:SNF2 family DNA or RNA helicase
MWYDPQRRLIIYNASDPLALAAACPDARQLPDGRVAVPAHMPNLVALDKLGLPLPRFMDDAYDWPIHPSRKPLPHQKTMANFMVTHPRSWNLSDMGTMKTLSALWAADFVMQRYPKGQCKCLIVAPLATLQRTWGDAIFENFLGRRSYVILHGTAIQREMILANDVDFYIINHDGLGVGMPENPKMPPRGFAAALMARTDIQIALVDEASAYNDAGTRRNKIARQLIARKPWLWLMTGTPTPNAPTDAYGMAKVMNNARGESFKSFQQRTMTQITSFKWVARKGCEVSVKDMLSPAIRFRIEDCVDLPECVTQFKDAELSPEQTRAYKKMKIEARASIGKGQITAVNEAAIRLKLIQIACGAVYDGARDVHYLPAPGRLRVLHEAIEQCSEKIIVFAPLTSVLRLLHKELSKSWSTAIVNGEVSYKERSDIFKAFQQDKDPRIIIADPRAMSHGLTLVAATMIIWYAPIDSNETYRQANKRIDRPGQTKTTTIVQIASTAVEREIYRRLDANESLQGSILKLME